MASKFELLSNVYDDVSKDVIRSPDKWQNFLASACYNYRLRFDEQLLVYSQRPDATAVLEFDKWNRRFNRKIKKGSKGIAVFSNENKKYIKYYFDISDTVEREQSKPVPVWQYKEKYQADVIETLENSYGELEKKDTLYDAVMSMAENITADNIPDYFSDLLAATENSFLEELDEDMISSMYRVTVQNSIAFMVLTRLGFNAKEYFDRTDFQAVVNFNTPDTLNALGFAASDISQMVLSEVAKTVKSFKKENRTFAEKSNADYTKAENKNIERGADNGTVRLHSSGRSSDTKSDRFDTDEFDYGEIFADEETVSSGKSQSDLLQLPDERNIAESSVGDRTQSESNGRTAVDTDGSTGRIDGRTESNRPNDLGAVNEQSETESTGNRDERGGLQSVTKELPPFIDKDLIPEIIKNSDDNLTHRKEFIVKRFSELKDKEKPNYVPILYAGKTKELTIGKTTVGYMQVKDGLLMYEGNYKTRTKESVFSWSVVAELMQNLIDNDEYLPKEEKEKTEPAQFSLFDFNETFVNESDVTADSQVSLFTDFGVSQQIVDEALCSGANEVNSRQTICAYFRRDWGLKNNTQFLKEHYEQGAFGFIFEGEQVSVYYDDKGIKISKGNYANRSGATLITWEQSAKRVRELLDNGRYMPQSELDKVDDFEIRSVADRLVEFSRNVDEDYTHKNEILPFINHHIKNIAGYPDQVEKVKELLNTPAYFNVIADEYADFMQALEDDGYFLRFHYGREYAPDYIYTIVKGMLREPIPFKAQDNFNTPSEYFISDDEIKSLIRHGNNKRASEYRLEMYSYYLAHPNTKDRVKMLKDKAGWSGGGDISTHYQQDSKGFTYSHNDLFRPYAKTTMPWKQVDKYISNMIANHEYLSQDDLKLVDYYERKRAALAIHHFYFGIPKEYPRLNDRKEDDYWESVENIAEQLKSPDRAAEIQSIMTELYNSVDFEDRYKEYADKGIKTINEFADGTFTCFGDKSKTIEPLIKAEKPIISFSVSEDSETNTLYKVLNQLKINDIDLFYNKDNVLIAKDDDNEWHGAEFYDFLINEAFVYTENGVLGINDELLKDFNVCAEKYNLSAEKENTEPAWLSEYHSLKSKYPNTLAFYQVGDFFETYADDAKVVAKHLDLVLTGRHINDKDRVAMCGFPVRNLDKNMERLNVFGFSSVISALNNGVRNEKYYPYPVLSNDNIEQKKEIPVGVIEYLANDGTVGYVTEYFNESDFLKDIEDNSYSGVPTTVKVYNNPDTNEHISTSFLNDLDPPMNHFEIVDYVLEQSPTFKDAKDLIDNFVNQEYEHSNGADFSDLTNVNVAYTNLGDNEEHEVQASVDLINFAVNKYYDGKLAESSQYKNLDELISFELEGLSFDDLVYIDEDKIAELQKTPVTIEQALQYIKNFNEISTEYTDENQYADLSNIALAYTTSENGEHEIQVTANLVDFTINQYIDDKLVYTEQYNSLDDMTEKALKWLDFDDLVSVSDESELKFKELSTQDTVSVDELATRLVNFVKDTDFYDYQNNLEIGDADEDKIKDMVTHLQDKKFCEDVINYLTDYVTEESINEHEAVITNDTPDFALINAHQKLIDDVTAYQNTLDIANKKTEHSDHISKEYKIENLGDLFNESKLVPKNNNSISSNSTIRRNYNLLNEICPEIFSKEKDYVKFESGSLMPLTIEWISDDRIAVAHYYKVNGDMLADPDMEFVVDVENRTLTAATYQQDNLALYQNVYAYETPNYNLQKDLNQFANQWFKNIKLQNYERVYDGLEIESDKESNSISTSQSKSRVQTFDLHPEIPMADRHNYNFAEKEIETVGKKERFRRNINAINVLRDCEFENRFATPEEQEILSGYVGWGGIPEAFDENNSAWADEFIELYTVLSPDEYESARASTLTAFYTPQPVISAIYKTLDNLGFKQGNILEPSCAIGNFIGMLPENMQNSKMFGVEIDTVSAGIAQQLYQKSSIMAAPFEKADIPDSFFDAVVGNVPFGDYKLNDKRYDKNNFLIHDYFFAKSLDKLRPGGVMCLVTSKGTMDKESSNVRRYLAQRADLLGAIRLPDNTFNGNAGTRVTSDILILQKRDRMVDIEPEWVQLDTDENGIRMNKYFVNHPEMILGNMVMESGRFKPESACKAFENADLSELLDKAVSNIKGEITEYSIDDDLADDDEEYILADPNVKNFSYTIYDGKIYFRENSFMREVKSGVTAENRIKGMIAIRNSVRRLLEIQSENYPDDEIQAEQANLNAVYDSFVAKYGYINSRANASVFTEDSSYFLICSLEIFKEGKFERKADMFTKRTIQTHRVKTHADNSIEAFGISMGEKAKVDMEYMCRLTGKSEDEIFADLQDMIFLNPDYSENSNAPKYLPSDEYLSGNVREKLRQAKDLAEKDERFKINAAALEKVQPVDLKPNDISVHLGVTWIPIKYIEQFMYELLDTPFYLKNKIKLHYNSVADAWNIEHKSADNINLNVTQKYGTDRKNAFHIIENTLNLRNVKVFDYEEDEKGKRVAILNKDETTIAQQKQKIIKQKFKDWIWRDPERREKLCKLYNEKFNCIRPREYDGSHIVFEGMNPEITLRTNQRNAAARGLYGGNSLFAHCVGAGKTYTMAAIAQESKRLGLCSKSLFVVPNHIVPQWASEYLTLYPSANILVATKKDFETKNRKKFCARIATGDYDAIIIGHSQFEKIPLSVGRQIFNINKQIQEIIQGIADLKENNGQKFTVKALEQTKKKLESKLKKLNDQSRKDDVVTFEELGVDRIFVDEAHYYKNLYIYSKMRNVAGISQTEAQKSSDLFMKCQYLDELTGGRGVMFATGTPISNSMVELYTMQRYLQYETLRKFGYLNFDSWAAQYGETVTAMELAPEGTGYRMKTRFAKFNNLPELMSIFRMCADIQTADMLKLPVPKAVYKNISVKPSEIQSEMVSDLADRADAIRDRLVKPYEDNMLKITNDGRKLALDQRLMNPAMPDFEGSKVNECIRNIYDIWENTTEKKSAQLVFCDLSTPKNKTIEMEVVDGEAKMIVFQNIYDDIRTKLIEKGVPPEEIAFIHDANNDKQKADLFAKVRSGKVRVLLGSTQKMGAGTNVQNKLIAIHHIDCPWRPSDLQQREGRIVRQGNENDEVYIFSYVTENTFDAYLYQLVENKQKFIGQVMSSKTPMRSIEDIDEVALSYAEIKMLATGNPLIKEKMDLDKQVEDLKLLESNYYSERYELEDKVVKEYPQQISMYKSQIKALEIDAETAKQHLKSSADYFGGMVINGETYVEKKAAGEAIIRIMKTFKHSLQTLPVGSYRGFEMDTTLATGMGTNYVLSIKGAMTHKVELGYDIYGNITRIDNCIDHFESDLKTVTNNLAETQRQLEIAKESLKEPFEQAEELAQKQERLNELDEILCLDSDDGFVDEEPDKNELTQPKREMVMSR